MPNSSVQNPRIKSFCVAKSVPYGFVSLYWWLPTVNSFSVIVSVSVWTCSADVFSTLLSFDNFYTNYFISGHIKQQCVYFLDDLNDWKLRIQSDCLKCLIFVFVLLYCYWSLIWDHDNTSSQGRLHSFPSHFFSPFSSQMTLYWCLFLQVNGPQSLTWFCFFSIDLNNETYLKSLNMVCILTWLWQMN